VVTFGFLFISKLEIDDGVGTVEIGEEHIITDGNVPVPVREGDNDSEVGNDLKNDGDVDGVCNELGDDVPEDE